MLFFNDFYTERNLLYRQTRLTGFYKHNITHGVRDHLCSSKYYFPTPLAFKNLSHQIPKLIPTLALPVRNCHNRYVDGPANKFVPRNWETPLTIP